MPLYSISDADKDCLDMLQDFENYFDQSLDINQFHATVVDTPADVRVPLSRHLESLRFVKFAAAALTAEHQNISTCTVTHNTDNESKEPGRSFLGRNDFLSRLPFQIDLHIVSKTCQALSNAYESEISMKQLTRDLERDKVVLNGARLVGAAYGISGLIAAIGDCIDLNVAHCSLPDLSADLKQALSVGVLRMACRTNSGGLSFHALRSIVDPADVMLVPVSTLARSLSIKISVDAFVLHHDEGGEIVGISLCSERGQETLSASDRVSWGLCCEVQGSTFFKLAALGAADQPSARVSDCEEDVVEAVYRNFLCIEIDSKLKIMKSAKLLGGCSSEGVCGKLSFRLHQQ